MQQVHPHGVTQGLGRELLPHPGRTVKEEQPRASPLAAVGRADLRLEETNEVLFEVSGQQHGFEGSTWSHGSRERQQVLVHRLHVEQIMQDAVIDLHRTGEEAEMLVVSVGQIRDETVAQERCVGEQSGSGVTLSPARNDRAGAR